MANYYEIIGITKEECTPDALKKAYKKAALKWHPDKNPDDPERASAKFKQIVEAYEVLQDPDKKAAYDTLDASIQNNEDVLVFVPAAQENIDPKIDNALSDRRFRIINLSELIKNTCFTEEDHLSLAKQHPKIFLIHTKLLKQLNAVDQYKFVFYVLDQRPDITEVELINSNLFKNIANSNFLLAYEKNAAVIDRIFLAHPKLFDLMDFNSLLMCALGQNKVTKVAHARTLLIEKFQNQLSLLNRRDLRITDDKDQKLLRSLQSSLSKTDKNGWKKIAQKLGVDLLILVHANNLTHALSGYAAYQEEQGWNLTPYDQHILQRFVYQNRIIFEKLLSLSPIPQATKILTDIPTKDLGWVAETYYEILTTNETYKDILLTSLSKNKPLPLITHSDFLNKILNDHAFLSEIQNNQTICRNFCRLLIERPSRTLPNFDHFPQINNCLNAFKTFYEHSRLRTAIPSNQFSDIIKETGFLREMPLLSNPDLNIKYEILSAASSNAYKTQDNDFLGQWFYDILINEESSKKVNILLDAFKDKPFNYVIQKIKQDRINHQTILDRFEQHPDWSKYITGGVLQFLSSGKEPTAAIYKKKYDAYTQLNQFRSVSDVNVEAILTYLSQSGLDRYAFNYLNHIDRSLRVDGIIYVLSNTKDVFCNQTLLRQSAFYLAQTYAFVAKKYIEIHHKTLTKEQVNVLSNAHGTNISDVLQEYKVLDRFTNTDFLHQTLSNDALLTQKPENATNNSPLSNEEDVLKHLKITLEDPGNYIEYVFDLTGYYQQKDRKDSALIQNLYQCYIDHRSNPTLVIQESAKLLLKEYKSELEPNDIKNALRVLIPSDETLLNTLVSLYDQHTPLDSLIALHKNQTIYFAPFLKLGYTAEEITKFTTSEKNLLLEVLNSLNEATPSFLSCIKIILTNDLFTRPFIKVKEYLNNLKQITDVEASEDQLRIYTFLIAKKYSSTFVSVEKFIGIEHSDDFFKNLHLYFEKTGIEPKDFNQIFQASDIQLFLAFIHTNEALKNEHYLEILQNMPPHNIKEHIKKHNLSYNDAIHFFGESSLHASIIRNDTNLNDFKIKLLQANQISLKDLIENSTIDNYFTQHIVSTCGKYTPITPDILTLDINGSFALARLLTLGFTVKEIKGLKENAKIVFNAYLGQDKEIDSQDPHYRCIHTLYKKDYLSTSQTKNINTLSTLIQSLDLKREDSDDIIYAKFAEALNGKINTFFHNQLHQQQLKHQLILNSYDLPGNQSLLQRFQNNGLTIDEVVQFILHHKKECPGGFDFIEKIIISTKPLSYNTLTDFQDTYLAKYLWDNNDPDLSSLLDKINTTFLKNTAALDKIKNTCPTINIPYTQDVFEDQKFSLLLKNSIFPQIFGIFSKLLTPDDLKNNSLEYQIYTLSKSFSEERQQKYLTFCQSPQMNLIKETLESLQKIQSKTKIIQTTYHRLIKTLPSMMQKNEENMFQGIYNDLKTELQNLANNEELKQHDYPAWKEIIYIIGKFIAEFFSFTPSPQYRKFFFFDNKEVQEVNQLSEHLINIDFTG